MAAKYVYFFGDGKAEGKAEMKNLLGGKGANLAEMTSIGLPVPAGFTITTEVCTEYYKNNQALSRRTEGRGGCPPEGCGEPHGEEVRRPARTRCSSRSAPAPAPPCRA